MASTSVRKMLFTIFVVGNEKLKNSLSAFDTEFSGDARQNASRFSEEPRLEQIGHYYDWDNNRLVLTGVANAQGLIEISAEGQPQLVEVVPGNPAVREFVAWVKEKAGLQGTHCTWVVVPLDDLGNGFGTLHIKGMAGVSGG